jgi:hypothetical protein
MIPPMSTTDCRPAVKGGPSSENQLPHAAQVATLFAIYKVLQENSGLERKSARCVSKPLREEQIMEPAWISSKLLPLSKLLQGYVGQHYDNR